MLQPLNSTTRALSLVATGDEVLRDQFYNGNEKPEPGAIVCRVAPSFIRFGNFELYSARMEHEMLEKLCKFTLERDFPHIYAEHGKDLKRALVEMLKECTATTATMVTGWMRVSSLAHASPLSPRGILPCFLSLTPN